MKDTKIEWAHHTFNPWEGCTKVSPGCANCYAETRNSRFNKGVSVNWGHRAPRRRTSERNWNQPFKWNAEAKELDHRPRVFCASLADWLDPEVPIEWLADLLNTIEATRHLDWLLLTKRPHLWRERMEEVASIWGDSIACEWLRGAPPANVWIGTSVEDQERAELRIPQVLDIPARVRFLSCEPLLGPLDLVCMLSGDALHTKNGRWIDWIICGGESGPGARPMHPKWVRDLRDQCEYVHHSVPFLFKQWGEWSPDCLHQPISRPACKTIDRPRPGPVGVMFRCGKHTAGRELDGVVHNDVPTRHL